MASLFGLLLSRGEKKARKKKSEEVEKKVKQLPHDCDQISGPCLW